MTLNIILQSKENNKNMPDKNRTGMKKCQLKGIQERGGNPLHGAGCSWPLNNVIHSKLKVKAKAKQWI